MASPEKIESIVFQQSVTSRAENQPNGTIPFGGYTGIASSHDGLFFQLGQVIESIPAWSIYPWARDRMLRAFYKTEPIMAGAVYSISARIKALNYKFVGDEAKHDDLQLMFKSADYGEGFRELISKTITDICTQDNGAFWELIGMGNPAGELLGGAVLGFNYLDPSQCYRTFDPEHPILYIDPLKGSRHLLHKSRVIKFSSMPQPNELSRGVGFSPLSRALLSVQLIQSIQRYRYEKTSGQFERAIGYGTGMTQATLKSLVQQTQLEDENAGFVRFGKIPFFVSPRKEVNLDILDLASIPDGFDLKTEMETYVYTVSNAFGVDSREFWTATQSGATKADALVTNLKTRGKGLADLITMMEDAINDYIMPEGVVFEYDFVDEEHSAEVAKTFQAKVSYLSEIKSNGGLSDEQYQAMLIHEGILPLEILEDASHLAILPDDTETEEIDGLSTEDENEAISPNESEQETQTDDDLEDLEGIEKSLSSYKSELRSIMRGVIDGVLVIPNAVSATDSAVRRAMTQAAFEGLEKGGVMKGDISQQELLALQEIIFNEQDYVVGLVEYAATQTGKENPAYSAVFNRVDMWAARYDSVKEKFFMLADGNQKLLWTHNPQKDNCIDCITYSGKVYRAKVWEKRDIRPKMWDLTCRGGHCGCTLGKTDKPVTKGFPPKPKGRS